MLTVMSLRVESEEVVMQLKWEHEFQFAGFYAAQWQGYYEQYGLDVTLKSGFSEDKKIKFGLSEVINGRADFAIGSLDVIMAKDAGEDLIVLAPIFQKSPTAIVSLADRKIEKIADLVGLKVAVIKDDYTADELNSLFRFHGVDPARVRLINTSPIIKNLINGKVDAIITYGVTAAYEAQVIGQEINMLGVSKYSADFLGDVLYTHKKVYENNPKMVKNFVEATIKGWEYAMTHKPEMITRISNELPRFRFHYEDVVQYNTFFADVIDEYLNWPETDIGYIDFNHWNSLYNDLKYVGLISGDWPLSELFIEQNQSGMVSGQVLSLMFLTALLLILMAYWFLQTVNYKALMLISGALVFSFYAMVEVNYKLRHHQELRLSTLYELESIKSNLSGLLNSNVSLLKGLAAYIANNPDIDAYEFKSYSAQIFESGHGLINFAAAPELVVKLVYPEAGNEAVIGLDYRQNTNQIDSVLKASNSQQVVLDGPLKLVQGGDAIILRLAIFQAANKDQLWGVISAPIDLNVILSMSGAFQQNKVSELAIKKMSSIPKVIYGNDLLFEDSAAVKVQLNIADNNWQMVAKPVQGWGYPMDYLWLWRFLTALILAVIVYLLYVKNAQKIKNSLLKEAIKRNERLLLEVGELAHIGGWRINEHGAILQWTATSEQVLGREFPTQPSHLQDFLNLFAVSEQQKLKQAFEAVTQNSEHFDLEVKYFDHNKEVKWLRIISDEIIKNTEGYEVTGAIQEITDYKNINKLLEYQASHDSLTGLFNRFALNEQVENFIQNNQHDTQLMALFIDVDDFKNINDSMGHHVGDELLKSLSAALKSALQEEDILARYSGDEFVAIVNIDSEQDAIDSAIAVMKVMRQEYRIKDNLVLCTCSIGVAYYPEHSQTVDELINKADMAMYAAKQSGKNAFAVYSEELQRQADIKANIRLGLQKALVGNDFQVFFQPIYNLKTGQIIKFEALLRWFDEDGNPHDTEEYIKIAEESGLITEIDIFVLAEVESAMQKINQSHHQDIGVAVNVSPLIFHSQDSVIVGWLTQLEQLRHICEVTVEITERTLIDNPQETLHILNQLHERDIKVSIDDFGVGYSSLNYLTQYPINQIKIDRSFTSQIAEEPKIKALIKTIMRLANDIDIEVVAEGIESKQQLQFLTSNDCQIGQGYLFSQAVPLADAIELLKHSNINVSDHSN